MPTLTVRDAIISYSDTGAPVGRPDASAIVFGHGLLFGGWMFRSQIAALRAGYRCVAIDWRGQGDSPPAASGYDMDTLTSDAVALIDALGISPVHWVGLSMGGFVGLRLAARHGHLLRSLTLLGTSAAPETTGSAREYRRLAAVHRIVGLRPILGRVSPIMFGPAFLADPTSPPIIDEWVGRVSRTRRSAVGAAVRAVAGRAAVSDELDAIGVPTLVVAGAQDRAIGREHTEFLARGIAGARSRVIDDCGHTSTLEQPAAVGVLLREFIDSTG